jgi:hypothetical protein
MYVYVYVWDRSLNEDLPAPVFVPLPGATDELRCVLRVAVEVSFI